MSTQEHYQSPSAPRVLSREQIEQYWTHGFLVLPRLVPTQELDKYRQRFIDYCDGKIEKIPGMTIMKDLQLAKSNVKGEKATYKIQDFTEDPLLFSFCQRPEIVSVVEDLIGGPCLMAMHTMLINKPPDKGALTSRHPMHQDLHYFPFRPADNIVCAWTAMEHVDQDNGCLQVVPGSHKGALKPHGYPDWEGGVNKAFHGIQGYEPAEREYAIMEAGDTIFFHPLLVHGSGANRTNRFRKAISCHYANGSLCDYIDIEGTSQQNIADEVAEIMEKKMKQFGHEVKPEDLPTFQDVWRLRSKPVYGERAHL